MRLSIIVDDGMVIIDGVAHHIPDLETYCPPNLHALQWYGTHGEEEYRDYTVVEIENLDSYSQVIDLWTQANNPPPLPREEVEELIWQQIKNERDYRQQNGGFLVDGHWFHSDNSSRIQQMRLEKKAEKVLENGGTEEDMITTELNGEVIPIHWKTMTGEFVPMTVSLAMKIGPVAEALEAMLFQVAEQHRAAMESSSDPASYDFSGGWPTAFWEREE